MHTFDCFLSAHVSLASSFVELPYCRVTALPLRSISRHVLVHLPHSYARIQFTRVLAVLSHFRAMQDYAVSLALSILRRPPIPLLRLPLIPPSCAPLFFAEYYHMESMVRFQYSAIVSWLFFLWKLVSPFASLVKSFAVPTPARLLDSIGTDVLLVMAPTARKETIFYHLLVSVHATLALLAMFCRKFLITQGG
jgi:hypothetical protein